MQWSIADPVDPSLSRFDASWEWKWLARFCAYFGVWLEAYPSFHSFYGQIMALVLWWGALAKAFRRPKKTKAQPANDGSCARRSKCPAFFLSVSFCKNAFLFLPFIDHLSRSECRAYCQFPPDTAVTCPIAHSWATGVFLTFFRSLVSTAAWFSRAQPCFQSPQLTGFAFCWSWQTVALQPNDAIDEGCTK